MGPLIEALKHEEWHVAGSAAEALGEIGDAAAVGSLIEALKHEEWHVAISAAEALGKIGDAAAFKALIKAKKLEAAYQLLPAHIAQTVEKLDAILPIIPDRKPPRWLSAIFNILLFIGVILVIAAGVLFALIADLVKKGISLDDFPMLKQYIENRPVQVLVILCILGVLIFFTGLIAKRRFEK